MVSWKLEGGMMRWLCRFLICHGLLIMGSTILCAEVAIALPDPGQYDPTPGSSTTAGPFTTSIALDIDAGSGTASFTFESTSYTGSFTTPTTLAVSQCVFLPPSGSKLESWQFLFDTDDSFAWTGTTTEYPLTACSGGGFVTRGFTNVTMVRDDPCSPNPCLNGGICAPDAGAFTCSCPAGYGGPLCADVLPSVLPGAYEPAPGESSPFPPPGILTLTGAATAIFEIDGILVAGTFTDPDTLELSGCTAWPSAGVQLAVNWRFDFDSVGSFTWSGDYDEFSDVACTQLIGHTVVGDVSMVRAGTHGVPLLSYGAMSFLVALLAINARRALRRVTSG